MGAVAAWRRRIGGTAGHISSGILAAPLALLSSGCTARPTSGLASASKKECTASSSLAGEEVMARVATKRGRCERGAGAVRGDAILCDASVIMLAVGSSAQASWRNAEEVPVTEWVPGSTRNGQKQPAASQIE